MPGRFGDPLENIMAKLTDEWMDLVDFASWNKKNLPELERMLDELPKDTWRHVYMGFIVASRKVMRDLGIDDPLVSLFDEQSNYIKNTFGDRND